jgi:thiamine pyrophosphokinase
MKNRIAIIANGPINNNKLNKELLENFDIYICADGGANNAKNFGIVPKYIIGDMDSINKSSLIYFKNHEKIEIIRDTNQDKTDLELAIDFAQKLNPKQIIIFGAIGSRIDHTLANIYCLDKIKSGIEAKIVDDKTTIELLKDKTKIVGKKDEIISVIPISSISNLKYSGFKWNVENLDTKPGWFGISNKIEKESASISFSDGKLLLIRVRKNDD